MALRHGLAAQAIKETDLLNLAQMLAHAVDDCRRTGVLPHLDTAVQVLCHQIAFAGNGDGQSIGDYVEAFKECAARAPNTDFLVNVKPLNGKPQ